MTLVEQQEPRDFDSLLGQPTAQKLFKKWSLDPDKHPDVVFLVGESGRGKTTSIKLLSALATCKEPKITKTQVVPCGACPMCKNVFEEKFSPMKHVHFFSGRAANVDLIEQVESMIQITPVGVKNRVIIFDELQDASKGFLKALLSLLEKKGRRTKFIIASMEAKALKMPGNNPNALTDRGTLVKFGKIKNQVILDRLFELGEKVLDPDEKAPDTFFTEVIKRIVVESAGSMRRAVRLLETCFDAEAWTDELADAVLLDVSEKQADEVLLSILDKSPETFDKLSKLDSPEGLYRLANAKMLAALKKHVTGTLDAGDFYSKKCQEVFLHKNYSELRESFKRVHNEMGSYWRNDIFETIICEYMLAEVKKPVRKIIEEKTGPRNRR